MKNIAVMIMIITLCYFSILWADEMKPKEFEAAAGDGVVYLYWSSPTREVKGYWVYRALPSGNYKRVNSTLVERTFYEDRDVVNGQFYWYMVTPIGPDGNEGTPSKTVGGRPNRQIKPFSRY